MEPQMSEHILLRHRDIEDFDQLDVYRKHGGFETYKQVLTDRTPEDVIEIVKASGLRGRGGAGFPTGLKWSLLAPEMPRYVAVNADESEPGTFKDREIMEGNPFQMLEGSAICAYASKASAIYIYFRGEFCDIAAALDEKI